ncbi:ABC transporter permease [Paractinoplanes durhamensis]|uniref:Transport permease protein n=1 Tax=Paractinoplanes durhamensis TaxID=113563 RepID=A0ABQ3Z740_9ACTN|nr:ABC transporter permease [Actinoplanes durhamensis]GIE05647.1 transport permease protein [Actinoplanes durhamensis]
MSDLLEDTRLSAGELARRHGLASTGALPGLSAYGRQLWANRHFVSAYAHAKTSSRFGSTRLGALWQVLTPLLNAAVYYLIFGVVADTRGAVGNFIPYLCCGVFVFGFTQSVVQGGINLIRGNLGMIRALHFPRGSLPLGLAIAEARNLVASMSVLVAIVLLTGERLTWQWLMLLPALLLQAIFNAGLAMWAARLGSQLPDLAQLMPFIIRIWLYSSAVLYPVARFSEHLHGWQLRLAEANPLLVFIELVRLALLENVEPAGTPSLLWTEAACWTAVAGLGGFVYFWRGEKEYGRG